MALPIVIIAIGGEKYFGFYLSKTIQNTLIPKSGEHEDQIAPILVVASIAITVSVILGTFPATRLYSHPIGFMDAANGGTSPYHSA